MNIEELFARLNNYEPLTTEDSFCAAFALLDKYYRESDDDKVCSLLSDMDPYLFKNSLSADPAVYGDWCRIIAAYQKDGRVEYLQMLFGLKELLAFYQKEFGFEHQNAIDHFASVIEKTGE